LRPRWRGLLGGVPGGVMVVFVLVIGFTFCVLSPSGFARRASSPRGHARNVAAVAPGFVNQERGVL
jgi:hypothetical protein